MVKNNKKNVFSKIINKKVQLTSLFLLSAIVPAQAFAEVLIENDQGWKLGMNGHIPVFAIVNDNDALQEDAFRITTGFNPATAQFNVYAPKQDGVSVSGHFQLNSHLAGANGVQNSGFGGQGAGRVSGVESRVAEIAVTGDFGTINIGKGFGIFGTPAIGDSGSGLGVGLFNPNAGDATAGRIGNGYFYANFNPRITYTSENIGGAQVKVGLFQPEKPKDGTATDNLVGTELPRIEANIVWSNDMLTLWSSSFYQKVNVDSATIEDFDMLGIDFGGAVIAGDFNVRANYSMTKGTGNGVVGGHGITGGSQEEDADQWYIEGTYNIKKMKIGASYGEGSDDLTGVDTDLAMLFLHHRLNESLTMMLELQTYGTNVPNSDYNAVILGTQFTF